MCVWLDFWCDWGVPCRGTLRFRYTGTRQSASPHTNDLFDPLGLTTDSQYKILAAEYSKSSIHILEKDGHFHYFIGCVGLI